MNTILSHRSSANVSLTVRPGCCASGDRLEDRNADGEPTPLMGGGAGRLVPKHREFQQPGPVQMAPALLRCAMALVDDDAVLARALVARTLEAAHRPDGSPAPSEAELFRLLRRAYHSIEHSRARRPVRDAVVNSLAAQQRPRRTDQDG